MFLVHIHEYKLTCISYTHVFLHEFFLYSHFNIFSVWLSTGCLFSSCDSATACLWLKSITLILSSFRFSLLQNMEIYHVPHNKNQNYLPCHKRLSMTGPHILFPVLFPLHGSHKILLPVLDLNFPDFSNLFEGNRPWIRYHWFSPAWNISPSQFNFFV